MIRRNHGTGGIGVARHPGVIRLAVLPGDVTTAHGPRVVVVLRVEELVVPLDHRDVAGSAVGVDHALVIAHVRRGPRRGGGVLLGALDQRCRARGDLIGPDGGDMGEVATVRGRQRDRRGVRRLGAVRAVRHAPLDDGGWQPVPSQGQHKPPELDGSRCDRGERPNRGVAPPWPTRRGRCQNGVRREDAGRGGLRSMSTAGRGGDRRAGPAHPRPGGLRVLAVSLRDPAFGTGRHRRRARQGRPPLPAPACAPSPATPTASPGMAFSPAGGCWPPAAWTRRCSCGPYPGRRAADQAWPNMRRGLEKPGRPGVRKGIPDRLPDTTGRPLRRGSRPGCDFRG